MCGEEGARECVWERRYFPLQERKETSERPAIVGGGAWGGGGMYPSGKRCVSGIKRERAAARGSCEVVAGPLLEERA